MWQASGVKNWNTFFDRWYTSRHRNWKWILGRWYRSVQRNWHPVFDRGVTSKALVLCFLLRNSPASEFYMPTFRNNLFHLHRQVGVEWLDLKKNVGVLIWENVLAPTCLWRWNRMFRNVGIWNSDAGELRRRKHTTFRTRRKFEIKK